MTDAEKLNEAYRIIGKMVVEQSMTISNYEKQLAEQQEIIQYYFQKINSESKDEHPNE